MGIIFPQKHLQSVPLAEPLLLVQETQANPPGSPNQALPTGGEYIVTEQGIYIVTEQGVYIVT